MEPLVVRLFEGDRDFTLNKLGDVIGSRSGSLTAGSLVHHVVQNDLPTRKLWARHGNSPTDVLQISVKGPLLECSLEDFEPFPDTIQEVKRILGGHGPAAEVYLTQNLLKYELFRRPEIVFLKDVVVAGKSDSFLQDRDAQNPFYDEKTEEVNLEMRQNLAHQLVTGFDFEEVRFSRAQQGEICTKGGKLKRNGEDVLDLKFCTIFHSCSAQRFQIVLVGCWNTTISIWLEDRSHFNCWLSGFRLIKFGSKLRSCFCCRTDDKEGPEHNKDDPFKKSENFLSRLGKLKLGAAVSSKCCSTSLASSRQSSKSSFLSSSVPTSVSSGSSSRRVSSLESRSPIIHDNDDDDQEEEEEEEYGLDDDIFAAVYRSEGEFKIVTDPAKVDEIKKEEMMRRRRSSQLQQQLSKEPWYSAATADAITNALRRNASIDGVFLVRTSNFHSSEHPDLDTFALMLMAEEKMCPFRILQKPMFGKTVFTLDHGQTNFPSVASLVEFYQHNKGILPCLLTEYPRL